MTVLKKETNIECKIDYIKKSNGRKSQGKIMKEIEKNCDILERWVNDLPNYIERKEMI